MSLPNTEEVALKIKEITITVNVSIPVLTCKMCSAEGDYVPNTLNRPTYDRPWSLQGFLYPQHWINGYCPTCAALQKAVSGVTP